MGNHISKTTVVCGAGTEPTGIAPAPKPKITSTAGTIVGQLGGYQPYESKSKSSYEYASSTAGSYVHGLRSQPPMVRQRSPRGHSSRPEFATEIWIRPPPSGEGITWDQTGWKDYRAAIPDMSIEVGKLFRILSAVDGIHDPLASERIKAFLTSDMLSPAVDVSKYKSRAKVQFNAVFWNVMHMLPRFVRRWDKRTQRNLRGFYHDIALCHPCTKCRSHYTGWLQRYPVPAHSKKQLVKWMVDLHNEVNMRTGKPIFDVNLVDVRWGVGPYLRSRGEAITSEDFSDVSSSPDSGYTRYSPSKLLQARPSPMSYKSSPMSYKSTTVTSTDRTSIDYAESVGRPDAGKRVRRRLRFGVEHL